LLWSNTGQHSLLLLCDRETLCCSAAIYDIAIMATREGLSFETTIESDCAPLWEPVRALVRAGIAIHCLRDLTRGGRFALTLRNLRFRSRKMYLVRARFSGLIPSTLPTKAALSPSFPSAKQREGYRFSPSIPSVGRCESVRFLRSRAAWSQ
jgi:hypothetical protein